MNTLSSESGVIWDMDGTLVDTADLHFAAWSIVARELDYPFTKADFAATFGRRNPEIIQHLFQKPFSETEMAELADRKESLYREAARAGITLLPGVRPLLEALGRNGIRQAIGSSAPRANLELILELTDTRHFFDAVVSMEDTTQGKPDPQVFLVAAAKLGVPPHRCTVIEDAVAGVQAAKAGGMTCIGVTTGGHATAEALQAAGADFVTASLEHVTPEMIVELGKQN